MKQTITVPQLAWYDPKELAIWFPENWQVEVCNMAGYNRPALTDAQIEAAVTKPLDTPPLRELARNKKEVVIIFDDMTRVTRTYRMLPPVLKELAAAGIDDHHIRFVCASGSHAPLDRFDFVKKLGEDVVSRFPVYNHNVFHNCTYVGTSSYGNKIYINSEVMQCDLKIAIGTVTPHPGNVFGGGAKIVLPGISSIETIRDNHSMDVTREQLHNYDANPRRLEKVEAGRFVGLDMVIQSVVNLWGDPVAVYAGSEGASHAATVTEAGRHYLTPKAKNKDIVIANAYAKASEETIAYRNTASSLGTQGGDCVLISNAPGGQIAHYLFGKWGTDLWGILNRPIRISPPVNHLIQYTEYPDLANSWFKPVEKVVHHHRWDDVISTLRQWHGDRATVAVYPNADIALFEERDDQ